MNYRLGIHYVNHKYIYDFVDVICKELNISTPKVNIITTKYTKEFYDKYYDYQDSSLRLAIKSKDIDFKFNPPKIDLNYYDSDLILHQYEYEDGDDSMFLGIYHTDEETIYINLGLIYLSLALHCLNAKKRHFPHYFLTERKLSVQIKKTIMHECYHHYQKINDLKFDCFDCDSYALKTIRNKEILHYKVLEN